jgi:16S rRNA (guanine527-N7)-methyltransferase
VRVQARGVQDFAERFPVSRETLQRLEQFVALLRRWQARINLVSDASLADVWRRHVLDSAQLLPLAEAAPGLWLDLGSGAGFPGLVVAALGRQPVHLVERDARKAAFLREAARICGLEVVVHARAIADLPPLAPAVISARALAPLPALLELAAGQLGSNPLLLFPKGQDVGVELTKASRYWIMHAEKLPSMTDPTGVVLRLRGLERVGKAE